MPTAISSAVSATAHTETWTTLPAKYAVRGIGVPNSRLSMPLSRSVAMVMARYWKLVDMMPPAIMPAVNSWPTVTPWAAAWLPKIDPSRTSRIGGSPKMNATAILSRKNALTSTPPRAAPSRHTPGREASLGRVLARRPGDGEPGDLAAELDGQLGDRGRRRSGLDGAARSPGRIPAHPRGRG